MLRETLRALTRTGENNETSESVELIEIGDQKRPARAFIVEKERWEELRPTIEGDIHRVTTPVKIEESQHRTTIVERYTVRRVEGVVKGPLRVKGFWPSPDP